MNIKINIVNDRFTNISPLAFGNIFCNLSEYFEDESPVKTFENMGVYRGKTITDYDGEEYKVVNITEMNEYENRTDERVFRVDLRKLH